MAYTTIDNADLHFQVKTYSGNGTAIGSGGQAITLDGTADMQPDLVWVKRRDSGNAGQIHDSVRGATKFLPMDGSTDAQETNAETLTAFNTDGFTVGSHNGVNNGSGTYVSWSWKGNGSGSANTDGSINSTVSVNTTAGFSIVSYTGTGSVATVGHGLGKAPEMIIVKRLDSAEAMPTDVRAANNAAGGILYLNETGTLGAYGDSSPFPSTAPTSTVFSIGTANNTNASSAAFIAYCFAPIKGYSKMCAWTGNGSTDGRFVMTGFKPILVIQKCTDASGDWRIWDTVRDPDNIVGQILYPSHTNGESGETWADFLANGFKIRSASNSYNGDGNEYICLAIGQTLVGSNNACATAR